MNYVNFENYLQKITVPFSFSVFAFLEFGEYHHQVNNNLTYNFK